MNTATRLRLRGKPTYPQSCHIYGAAFLSPTFSVLVTHKQRSCQALLSKLVYKRNAFRFLNTTPYYNIECDFSKYCSLSSTPILSSSTSHPLLETHWTARFYWPIHDIMNLQPILSKVLRVFSTGSPTGIFAMLSKVGEGLIFL